MGRIPLRDDHGRWAGSMSDGHNKSAKQRLQEFYQHTGRNSRGLPLGGPSSMGWKMVANAGYVKTKGQKMRPITDEELAKMMALELSRGRKK